MARRKTSAGSDAIADLHPDTIGGDAIAAGALRVSAAIDRMRDLLRAADIGAMRKAMHGRMPLLAIHRSSGEEVTASFEPSEKFMLEGRHSEAFSGHQVIALRRLYAEIAVILEEVRRDFAMILPTDHPFRMEVEMRAHADGRLVPQVTRLDISGASLAPLQLLHSRALARAVRMIRGLARITEAFPQRDVALPLASLPDWTIAARPASTFSLSEKVMSRLYYGMTISVPNHAAALAAW